MYNVSQDYLDFINDNSNIGRNSKSKVVIDNIEYFTDTLKTNPKISHKATSLIGGFPAKSCNFEILNLDGSLSLNNKEIEVYKGLEIDGSVEWVKMGIFHAKDEDITTDQTTKSISFSGTDRATNLDDDYSSNLDWSTSHTGLEIVQEICTAKGITLETTDFNFATHVFTEKPNFVENITYREVIARLAEIGGEIAFISRNGGLRIAGQNTTNQTVSKSKREKITKENEFKINTVVLGKNGIDDDIVYKNQELIDTPKTRNKLDYSKIIKSTSAQDADAISGTLETHPGGFKYTASKAHTNRFIAQYIFNGTGDIFIKGSLGDDKNIRVYVYSDELWGTQIKNFSLAEGSTVSVNGKAVIGFYYSSAGAGDVIDVYNLQLEYGTAATSYVEFKTWGVQEWRIEDNPYVDLIREDIIQEVASHIIGISVIPFSLNGFIDDYIYDLNDVISVTDNNGNTFNAVMLEYETQSRIKSNIAASTDKTDTTTNYNIAGSVKQSIAKVSLEVDHNKQEIRSLATKTENVESKVSDLESSIDYFSVDLSQYALIIPTDSSKKPLGTKAYTVNFYGYYKGEQITPTVNVNGSYGGITVTKDSTSIKFSVNANKAITNELNEYTVSFRYGTDTITKKIELSLAVAGAGGEKGEKGDPGADGKGVQSITNYYLATNSSSGVTTDTSGWTTTVQNVSASKKYLWNYEKVTYTNNTSVNTTPCIIGAYGDKGNTGATGKGISSVAEKYAVSSSNTTAPTTWYDTLQTMTATNKYLWNYEIITYTDNTTEETIKRIIGVYGDKGEQGIPGTPGTSTYFYVRYSANSNGNPMTTSPTTSSKYMGVVSTTSNTAPTSYTAYTWTLIKGADGEKGNPGTPGAAGADGKSSYLHIKYSDDGTTFTANAGETPGRYRGELVDFVEEDSTTFSDYKWYDMGLIVDDELDAIRSEIVTNTTQINQTTEQIVLNALEEYVRTSDYETFKQTVQTAITQTHEDITFSFDTLSKTISNMDTDVQEQFQEISKYIRFNDGGISLGEVNNDITLRIENDIIYFSVAGVSVMNITPNGIEIDSAKFKNRVEIASFAFVNEDDGSFSLVKI